MQTVPKYLILLILSYQVRKKTAFLRYTPKQVGKGNELHFQSKNLARAKLAAINNKNGYVVAEVLCRNLEVFRIIDTNM